MELILQTVCELAGVTAAFVFNGSGQVAGHQGHAIYDGALVDQVSQSLVKALESVQLQMADWDAVTAQFEDGKLLLRNLGNGTDGQPWALAVVTDSQLNAPFVAVALRVAVQKLKKVLDGTAPAQASRAASNPGLSRPPAPSAAAPRHTAPPARAQSASSHPQHAVAESGMTWSKLSGSSGSSGIEVADAASSEVLTRCSKELARHIGPMSKIYVKEAVRRVSPAAPFSLAMGKQLVDDLATQIEDRNDRAAFRKALEKL